MSIFCYNNYNMFSMGLPCESINNPYKCVNYEFPSINNSLWVSGNNNSFNFNGCFQPFWNMNWNFPQFNQWSIFNFNTFNFQTPTMYCGNLFYGFNVNNKKNNTKPITTEPVNNNKYTNTNSQIGNEVEDGTSITVDGIDYSIMGKNNAEKVKCLRPEMQRKVYKMFLYAKENGWTMTITSGYRSTKKQTFLYNEWKAGRHKVPVVAKPGTSRHEYGCAVDINLTCAGKTYNELMTQMGNYGKSIGLSWGGNWRSNRELWHFDLNPKKTPKACIA